MVEIIMADNIISDEEKEKYYKSIRDPKELDEIPDDMFKKLYLEAVNDLDEFKKEHAIMKRFIYNKNLWNEFLNYDSFVEYLKTEWKGDNNGDSRK